MKIGIFGGSFNPIHKGHINIAQHAIQNLNLDKLFLVPAYKSPFKKLKLANAQYRIDMIKLHLNNKMEVSDFEIKRKGISYTIETLNFFRTKYPRATLYIIIGSDQLYKINKWKDINKIADWSQIVTYRRNQAFSKINIKKYNCILLNNEFYNESSTTFRKGDFSVITNEVASYIGQNHLYIKDLLSMMLAPKRHKHSIAVATFAVKLAKSINYNVKNAWVAAVFHDITKNWNEEKHRTFLKNYKIDGSQVADYQLHSLTGSIWIDKVYRIHDDEIVAAIRHHTTLNKELSLLDKIVYAADKLCQGRRYVGVQVDRNLIFKDFELGFKNVVKKTYEHLKTHRPLTPEQNKIYKEWI